MTCETCGEKIKPAVAAIGGWVHLRSNSRWCRNPAGEWVKAVPVQQDPS